MEDEQTAFGSTMTRKETLKHYRSFSLTLGRDALGSYLPVSVEYCRWWLSWISEDSVMTPFEVPRWPTFLLRSARSWWIWLLSEQRSETDSDRIRKNVVSVSTFVSLHRRATSLDSNENVDVRTRREDCPHRRTARQYSDRSNTYLKKERNQ